MLIISIISVTIFMFLYTCFTIKHKDNNWYNQFVGSYVFWYNRLTNKITKYTLLVCYCVFWTLFLFMEGIDKHVAIVYSSLLSAIVGYVVIDKKEKFLTKLHSSVLQISVWTGIIFVLVRCINYWWISILSLLIPFLPFIYNRLVSYNKVEEISGEIITFDVIYIWLAIYTICI